MPAFLSLSLSVPTAKRSKMAKCLYAGQEEVGSSSDRREGGESLDLCPDGPVWNGHVESAILGAKNWIALIP